jgi:cell division septation protein DedD
VSPERDDPTDEQEHELYEDVPPRSIFAATWFRVVLVVIVLGVIGAVAVPYVLDWMNPPPPPRTAAAKPPGLATPAPTPLAPTTERLPLEKKESTTVPAPPPPGAAPSAPDSKSGPRPGAASSPASAEPKAAAKAIAPEPKTPPLMAEPKSKSTAGSESPARAGAAKPRPEAAVKSDATTKSDATAAARPSASRAAATTGGGPYWVQVGAFRDPETAKRVAAKLREENFRVEESLKRSSGTTAATAPAAKAPASGAADQYDVFVSGLSSEELNRRLAGKGLSAETSGSGVVVKPSLPLRDAVALSKDLAVEGFKVQVRRAGAGTTAAAAPPAGPTEGGQAWHRVRVGAFAERAAAVAAARELEAKGYKPYIARGDQ